MNKYLEKVAYKTRAAHSIGKIYASKGKDEKAYEFVMGAKSKYEHVEKAKNKYYELADSNRKKKKKKDTK